MLGMESESEMKLELARPQFTTVCTMPDTVALATPLPVPLPFPFPLPFPETKSTAAHCSALWKLLEAK